MNEDARDKAKDIGKQAASSVIGVVLKPLVRLVGDKMETAKRPFWRKLVRAFRGEKKEP